MQIIENKYVTDENCTNFVKIWQLRTKNEEVKDKISRKQTIFPHYLLSQERRGEPSPLRLRTVRTTTKL